MVPRYGVTTLLLYGSVCPLVLLLYYLLLKISAHRREETSILEEVFYCASSGRAATHELGVRPSIGHIIGKKLLLHACCGPRRDTSGQWE